MKRLLLFTAVLLALGIPCMRFARIKNLWKPRPPAMEPYITGDNFRAACNHIFDETKLFFNPSRVTCGDTVFVAAGLLDSFFSSYHHRIQHPYILITHNDDASVPGGSTANGSVPHDFRSFVDDPKIFAWFGQNVDLVHPKLIPIPIGLQNEHWGAGYPAKIVNISKQKIVDKKYVLYGNFRVGTSNPKDRQPIFDYFKNQPFCYFSEGRKSLDDYLLDVAQSKFVLSPPGNGEDCHRTWEALYCGVYPIVRKSALDQMFAGLPVVIIEDWGKITVGFLEQKYQEITSAISEGRYTFEKMNFAYWVDRIKAKQQECRSV